MKIKRYLTVHQNKTIRMTAGKPDLTAHEIAVELNLEIPDSFFRRPVPVVTVVLPDVFTEEPYAVVRALASNVSEVLGLDIERVVDGLTQMQLEDEDDIAIREGI